MYSIISRSIFYLILLVFVSFIMISLHVKNLTAIQQSPCETRRIERRMNVTVYMIIIIFALLHVFLIARNVYMYIHWFIHTLYFAPFLYLDAISALCAYMYVNFSCNPYILFFLPIVISWQTNSRTNSCFC